MSDKPASPPVQMRQAQAHLRTLKADAAAAEALSKRTWDDHQAARVAAEAKRSQASVLERLITDYPELFGKAL